jgi:hypothetical protein
MPICWPVCRMTPGAEIEVVLQHLPGQRVRVLRQARIEL